MINEDQIDNQEIEETEEELQEDTQQNEEPVPQEPVQQNNDFEENVKQLRESKKREQERAERAEYERDQILQYVQRLNNPQGVQQQEAKKAFVNEDDYVEPQHVNYINDTLEGLRKEVSDFKMHNEEVTADLKLKAEFSDFNNIVTRKNIKNLLDDYPEMEEIIRGRAPLYTRGKATYRLIKKFLDDKTDDAMNHVAQNKINNNFNKPRPAVSATPGKNADTQLNYANLFSNGYTDEVKKHLRRQMDEAIEKYNNRN